MKKNELNDLLLISWFWNSFGSPSQKRWNLIKIPVDLKEALIGWRGANYNTGTYQNLKCYGGWGGGGAKTEHGRLTEGKYDITIQDRNCQSNHPAVSFVSTVLFQHITE